jgi:hypothetical protein
LLYDGIVSLPESFPEKLGRHDEPDFLAQLHPTFVVELGRVNDNAVQIKQRCTAHALITSTQQFGLGTFQRPQSVSITRVTKKRLKSEEVLGC